MTNVHDDFAAEVRANVEALGNAMELRELSRKWILETSRHRYSYNFSWLGRPIIQYPQDMVAIQELVWQIKPELIIETGIAHGGSLILSASLLATLDYAEAATAKRTLDPRQSRRSVLGVDIELRPHNRSAIESHALAHLITIIEGSSTAPDVVERVREHARNYKKVLVCLDSNHTAEHVLAELHAYAPLVSPDSYCVVFDTIIEYMPDSLYENRPWRSGNSPMTAIDRYLADLANREIPGSDGGRLAFEIDVSIDDKLQTSVAPRGFLRRTSP